MFSVRNACFFIKTYVRLVRTYIFATDGPNSIHSFKRQGPVYFYECKNIHSGLYILCLCIHVRVWLYVCFRVCAHMSVFVCEGLNKYDFSSTVLDMGEQRVDGSFICEVNSTRKNSYGFFFSCFFLPFLSHLPNSKDAN